jgi:hypothetical protein
MAHRFIILGNDFLPVNTRAEQLLAGRALNKVANTTNVETAPIWTGDPYFASDETGDVLDTEGKVSRKSSHYLSEENW